MIVVTAPALVAPVSCKDGPIILPDSIVKLRAVANPGGYGIYGVKLGFAPVYTIQAQQSNHDRVIREAVSGCRRFWDFLFAFMKTEAIIPA